MIATLRHRLIRVPARLIRHAGTLILRPPPGNRLLAEVLARIRALPVDVLTPPIPASTTSEPRSPEAIPGPLRCPVTEIHAEQDHSNKSRDHQPATRGFGSDEDAVSFF